IEPSLLASSRAIASYSSREIPQDIPFRNISRKGIEPFFEFNYTILHGDLFHFSSFFDFSL
ncbi:hypothetical protein V6O07_02930, partial [Arthrospira platensis SPKY2]